MALSLPLRALIASSLLLTVACSARPTEPQPRPGPHNAPRPVAGAAPAAPAR
jgi:hypothetical protein